MAYVWMVGDGCGAVQEFDSNEFLACIRELVKIDAECIPRERGESLYLRPTYIGTTVQPHMCDGVLA